MADDDPLDEILKLFPPMNPDQVALLRGIVGLSAASTDRDEVRLMRVGEVAERLRYSKATVYTLIRSGRLRAVRTGPGGDWRVTMADLRNFVAALDSNDVDWRSGR